MRLLEDISRTISEHGCNIVAHQGIVDDQMVKERFSPVRDPNEGTEASPDTIVVLDEARKDKRQAAA